MTLFPVLVDVYHKEQLVTKEEAKEAASDEWKWKDIVVTKDVVTAARLAVILNKHGILGVSRHDKGRDVSCM